MHTRVVRRVHSQPAREVASAARLVVHDVQGGGREYRTHRADFDALGRTHIADARMVHLG